MPNIPLIPGTATASGAPVPPAPAPSPSPAPSARPRRIRPWIAASTLVTASAGGVLVWAVAVPLGGLELDVPGAGLRVGPASIIVAALLGGVVAWLLLALLNRLPRGRMAWTAVAVAVLLLSLAGPAVSGAGGAVLGILELMHLLVGLVLILGLRRSTVPQSEAGRTVTGEAS